MKNKLCWILVPVLAVGSMFVAACSHRDVDGEGDVQNSKTNGVVDVFIYHSVISYYSNEVMQIKQYADRQKLEYKEYYAESWDGRDMASKNNVSTTPSVLVFSKNNKEKYRLIGQGEVDSWLKSTNGK